MSLREWFGFAPTLDGFAARLVKELARNGRGGWKYDAAGARLTHDAGGMLNLQNVFLEYAQAPRASRAALVGKYTSLALSSGAETPKLWELAAKGIYPVVRSRHDRGIAALQAQVAKAEMPAPIVWPLAGDLEVKLVFDIGDAMAVVSPETFEVWGQSRESVLERARANLRALEAPRWIEVGGGVRRLESTVSYEESFVLVDRVIASLGSAASVLLPCNRGVLLAADSGDRGAVRAMLGQALACLQEKPWPIGSTMLTLVDGHLQRYVPSDPDLAVLAANLERMSLAGTYHDQKSLLERLHGEDVYVASYSMLKRQQDGDRIMSWCSWSDGVPSLLPRTDLVALGRPDSAAERPVMIAWERLESICGRHMQATEHDPPRYKVESFPDSTEWTAVRAAGDVLGGE